MVLCFLEIHQVIQRGPGTPRPLNRPKVSLSVPMTTNGLPESTDSKESNLQQNEDKNHSDSPTSESEGSSASPVNTKHADEDAVEAEGREVKRLRFDKESEMASQTSVSEISSVMVEGTEASSSSQDKDKESTCTRQRCTEEDEEEDEEEEEVFYDIKRSDPRKKKSRKRIDDALTVNEETSEENNQMEGSDLTQAEKDLHSEGSENTSSVSSGSVCHETGKLVGSNSSKTGEIPSESSMENDDEATAVTDEPMEQD